MDLERDVRDVCEWLGWWEPGQRCHCVTFKGTIARGVYRCAVCGFTFNGVPSDAPPKHEKPPPKLDAMRVLRELLARGFIYEIAGVIRPFGHKDRPPTIFVEIGRKWLDEPGSDTAIKDSVKGESIDPAEAIIRAAAALTRQEKEHSGGTTNGR